MAIRDSMRVSAARYLRPGEHLESVIGAQTTSNYLAVLTGAAPFHGAAPRAPCQEDVLTTARLLVRQP